LLLTTMSRGCVTRSIGSSAKLLKASPVRMTCCCWWPCSACSLCCGGQQRSQSTWSWRTGAHGCMLARVTHVHVPADAAATLCCCPSWICLVQPGPAAKAHSCKHAS
jgi:hypothetical protein